MIGIIFSELISNSLKHARSPNGVRITSTILPSDDGFIWTYADNGQGLNPENVVRERQPLGMSLVQTLTDQLGGSMDIRNAPGFEARFTFDNFVFETV